MIVYLGVIAAICAGSVVLVWRWALQAQRAAETANRATARAEHYRDTATAAAEVCATAYQAVRARDN